MSEFFCKESREWILNRKVTCSNLTLKKKKTHTGGCKDATVDVGKYVQKAVVVYQIRNTCLDKDITGGYGENLSDLEDIMKTVQQDLLMDSYGSRKENKLKVFGLRNWITNNVVCKSKHIWGKNF